MNSKAVLSRRGVLGSLAASPLFITNNPAAAASTADARLLALGHDFDMIGAKIDYAISNRIDFDIVLLEELGRLDTEIIATQASTIQGLRVKARAACWALLGDIDPLSGATTDKRMALSIVRDLIRLHDPSLERPGAMQKLVDEIKSEAGSPLSSNGQAKSISPT